MALREKKLAALRDAIEHGRRSGVAEGYTIERVLTKLGLDHVPV